VQASTKRPARRRKRRAGRRGTQVGGHVGGAQHQPEQPGRRGRGRLHGDQAPGALDQPDQARCSPGVDSQLRVGFVLLGILDLHGTINKTASASVDRLERFNKSCYLTVSLLTRI